MAMVMGGEKNQAGEKRMNIVVGPWGGGGGTYWDDGNYSGVREIRLVYGDCIDLIQVVYDKNGKPVNFILQIKLQFPREFLTSVSGHYCPVVYGGSPVIRSLVFKSNQKTYGPFGVEEGVPFSFSTEGGVVTGFRGRSGWYLDAIGFSLSHHIQTTNLYKKVQKQLKKLVSTKSRS